MQKNDFVYGQGTLSYKEVPKEINENKLEIIPKDVNCASCETLLVRTVQILDIEYKNKQTLLKKENGDYTRLDKEVSQKYKFTCPKCGGKSFLIKFDHKFFYEPVEPFKIKDIIQEEDLWLVNLH